MMGKPISSSAYSAKGSLNFNLRSITMFNEKEWLVNAILVVAWAYIAFFMFPQALYLFIQTGGF
jgi:hypothetical protein